MDNAGAGMHGSSVMRKLPHRYPFLLIDRILSADNEHQAGQSRAVKNVTHTDPLIYQRAASGGVFPDFLILEALAQTAGALLPVSSGKEGQIFYFAGIRHAHFYKAAEAGDQLVMSVSMMQQRRNLIWFRGSVQVRGRVICVAEFICAGEPVPGKEKRE